MPVPSRLLEKSPDVIRAELTGFPAAAVESALRFREDGAADIRETGLYEVQITVMMPFPGTPLYARLAEQGRLLFPGAWERCTLLDVNFQPEKMSVSELELGFRELGARICDPAFIDERRRRFFQRQSELRAQRAVTSD